MTQTNQPQPAPQGNDKAPGEDAATEPGNDLNQSQKGKKVDADPEQETGKPANEKE